MIGHRPGYFDGVPYLSLPVSKFGRSGGALKARPLDRRLEINPFVRRRLGGWLLTVQKQEF